MRTLADYPRQYSARLLAQKKKEYFEGFL